MGPADLSQTMVGYYYKPLVANMLAPAGPMVIGACAAFPLLSTGMCYYQTQPTHGKKEPKRECVLRYVQNSPNPFSEARALRRALRGRRGTAYFVCKMYYCGLCRSF